MRAFSLPPRLSAKADPALIADDERHFSAIAASLERSIAELSDRLDSARLAEVAIGQEVMERDEEIHRLTARLRALRRFGLDLCLGRIVFFGATHATPMGLVSRRWGEGIEGAVDRYVAMTRATQRLVVLTS